jgi:Holliday junction resolvase RusA-like endonuclease
MKVELTIPGPPMGKQRPRVCKFGTYTPKETVNYETLVRELYIVKNYGRQLEGALAIEINAYFEIPKSAKKKDIPDMIEGYIRPTKKPDIDNILKIIGDSLNGLAYHDDSQIVDVVAQKCYSDRPRVDIEIWELEGRKQDG